MRFHYDPITDSSVKFNDRFEFPETLDLSEFIKQNDDDNEAMEVDNAEAQAADANNKDDAKTKDCQYVLHAVLVHSGDNHGGHYVVFINPLGNGQWCKFDDDVVSRCTVEEAVQNNFGGAEGEDLAARQSTNAYMLVYIRKSSCLKDIVCPVTEDDIPLELSERLNAEKQLEIVKRKEKTESHLYMTIRILFEDSFYGHQSNDLYEVDKVSYQEVRVKKQDSLKDVIKLLAKQIGQPEKRMRMWPMNHRTKQTKH